MRRRLIVVIIALAAFNAYATLGIVSRWVWAQQHILAVVFITLGCMVIELAGPIGDRLIFPNWRAQFKTTRTPVLFTVIDWLSYLALGMLSCLFIFTLMADAITLVWKLVTVPISTVQFDERILLVIVGATCAVIALGVRQAIRGPVLREIAIPIQNLPKGFDGFRILQISDLHVGPIIRRDYVAKVVAMANVLKPDLIACTGDFIDGSVADLKDDVAPLAQLAAPHGIYFITGNHEYYWGVPDWIKAFRGLGMQVLLNEHRVLTQNGDELILAGITDYSSPDSNPKKALTGAPKNLRRILLAHQPASYRAAHEAGFDLQISGHTHGGQYFPFNLVVKLFQRYVRGLNRHGPMWVYVSTGVGFWGPPLRAGIPSEINLITLKPAV